ncbi:ATP-grasp domain-containing protein [Candidatus Methylopumilus planktonicus]|uniref:ATP-grasp domain-containing protein n=1 Tax=Candidatus Methylopumilus planktonicus TaxID=1581557 RepID=UPI003BEF08DE
MTLKTKVLFVGAGPSQMPAIKHANSLGYESYAIDADPNAVGFEFAIEKDVGDIRDLDFIKVCAQRYGVNAVVAVATDVAVPSVARACQLLGLPSIPVKAADISVNKVMQRDCLKAAGIRVPKYMPFHNVNEAQKCVDDIGLPVVIKPSDSAGSRGVSLVQVGFDIIRAAEDALTASRSGTGIIEEYVDGTEVSVEGFVVDRIFYDICISEKTRTSPPYLLDTEVHFPDSLLSAERVSVLDLARSAVAACGLDNCPVHMEILRSSQGPVLVELAARGAGFRVFTNILPHVTGVDTVDMQLRLALGEKVKIVAQEPLKGAVITFLSPISGKLKSHEGVDLARDLPGIQEAEVYIEPGTVMGDLKCGADRIGHIIAFGETRQEAEIRTKQALALIKLKLE